MLKLFAGFLLVAFPAYTNAVTNIVLTNDDGWAVAQIRSEFTGLTNAGYAVVLSAPAEDESGTGSDSAPPTVLTKPCEFNTCPTGSPPEGHDASNTFLNYVNSFPVDSVRYGIQTLSPQLLGGPPNLIFSGVNVGSNLGTTVNVSGTVGAATEAALEGFPSIAFSGISNAKVSYTTLTTNPNSAASIAAGIYTQLSINFIQVLLNNPTPLLPVNTSLNINYPSTSSCTVANTKFILTRLLKGPTGQDVNHCGTTTLPDESSTIKLGCYATVSVFSALNKGDVPASTQAAVLQNIQSIINCLP